MDDRIVSYPILLHAGSLVIMLVSAMILVACGRESPIWEQMDIAEGFMNTKPDSALAILDRIPASNIITGSCYVFKVIVH